ncbi:MAG: tyrosine-type recombinase/integrase [Acidimicrobiales bacterium]
MAGSIRQRSPGVFELRVYLGRDSTGRIRHKHATFMGTKRAAERELARLVTNQQEDPARAPQEGEQAWGPTTTINDAIEGWKQNGWQDLSPNTVRGYEGVWRRNVRDSIGRRRIATLSPYDVERYFRDLKAAGAGYTTVRLARALLNRSCRLARKWSGNVLPNPVVDTELPSWGPDDRPNSVRSPEPAEVLALLEAARIAEIRVAVLIRLVAATGMRRGEACATRWNDVDEKAGTVTIDEGVVSTPAGAEARQPKTRSSTRKVALDRATLREIAALRREQDELAGACGLQLSPESFVFSFEPGGEVPPHPDNVSHAFAKIRIKAKVASDIHLHSLRHFHATQVDSVISEAQKQVRLGWSTVQMARHYTDGVPEEDRRAANHMGRVLMVKSGKRPGKVSAG